MVKVRWARTRAIGRRDGGGPERGSPARGSRPRFFSGRGTSSTWDGNGRRSVEHAKEPARRPAVPKASMSPPVQAMNSAPGNGPVPGMLQDVREGAERDPARPTRLGRQGRHLPTSARRGSSAVSMFLTRPHVGPVRPAALIPAWRRSRAISPVPKVPDLPERLGPSCCTSTASRMPRNTVATPMPNPAVGRQLAGGRVRAAVGWRRSGYGK